MNSAGRLRWVNQRLRLKPLHIMTDIEVANLMYGKFNENFIFIMCGLYT